jgi:hypothetical protein
MNVVKLVGGLGNQLFQYAFGKSLALYGIEVVFDNTWYNNESFPPRPYRLDKFCVNIKLKKAFPYQKVIFEKRFHEMKLVDNCYFQGYWQYPKYYKNTIPFLKDEFKIKEEYFTPEFLELKEKITNCDSVSIHVRRGDYITKENCYALPFNYYYEAITRTKGDLFIFSDEIDWCKDQFKVEYFDRNLTFIHLEDYLDFELIKLCKTKILANSTFSLWTAYLSEDSTIIMPRNWRYIRGSATPFEIGIPVPKHWIQI